MDPNCVICTNRYDTSYICDSCRVDPANDHWDESPLEPPPPGRPWKPTALHAAIAGLHLAGSTQKQIVKLTGATRMQVRVILKELGLIGRRA